MLQPSSCYTQNYCTRSILSRNHKKNIICYVKIYMFAFSCTDTNCMMLNNISNKTMSLKQHYLKYCKLISLLGFILSAIILSHEDLANSDFQSVQCKVLKMKYVKNFKIIHAAKNT